MLRGTRILEGAQAKEYTDMLVLLRSLIAAQGYEEVVVPAIWESVPFLSKTGRGEDSLWTFKDKGGRDCCLIPEVTALMQEMWDYTWKHQGKSKDIFYISRCYRYERPQAGRYREFTQIGVEALGESTKDVIKDLKEIMASCLTEGQWRFDNSVKRGLAYYVEDGFEVTCDHLGAQKQVAGGGRYEEGIGWAIGVERLLLAQK